MAKLIVEEGGRTTVLDLVDEVTTVGRRDGVAVRLADPQAGPEHCRIRYLPGTGYKLVDLESRHGTKVNGAFVNQHVLREGDVVQVGEARLRFSAAGPAPVAQIAPAPLPVPVTVPVPVPGPGAAPGYAAAAVAAPPARPAGRPVRRIHRGRSDQTLLVLAIAAVLVLVVAVAVTLMNRGSEDSANDRIYAEMADLMKQGRLEEALRLADQADPASDGEAWRLIQTEVANIRRRLEYGADERSDRAFREYRELEKWILANRADPAGAVERLKAFIAKWPNSAQANYARDRLEEYPANAGGAGVASSGGARPASIETEWEIAMQTVNRVKAQDRFQDAIDAVYRFWNAWEIRTGADLESWRRKVDQTVASVESEAAVRWSAIQSEFGLLSRAGKRDEAKELVERAARTFGIPKYESYATELLRTLSR